MAQLPSVPYPSRAYQAHTLVQWEEQDETPYPNPPMGHSRRH